MRTRILINRNFNNCLKIKTLRLNKDRLFDDLISGIVTTVIKCSGFIICFDYVYSNRKNKNNKIISGGS
jgi:hypothetical protein